MKWIKSKNAKDCAPVNLELCYTIVKGQIVGNEIYETIDFYCSDSHVSWVYESKELRDMDYEGIIDKLPKGL